MNKIEKSKWFKLVNRIIKKSFQIKNALTEQTENGFKAKNILIYCNSGAGPSCLLSSLA